MNTSFCIAASMQKKLEGYFPACLYSSSACFPPVIQESPLFAGLRSGGTGCPTGNSVRCQNNAERSAYCCCVMYQP